MLLNTFIKGISAAAIITVVISGCARKKTHVPDGRAEARVALMEADKAFSEMSRASGMKHAFIEYIDSNGVLLRTGNLPIIGANAIDYLLEQNDTAYTLTWTPQFADAAISGDMGYTFGTYELHLKQADSSIFGTYTSIWKKQRDGKWKFVLDTGNEGLGTD